MSKYYTPTIEEFHVGFEYKDIRHPNIGYTCDSRSPITYELEHIRVKYLDKEDIESLGWEGDNNSYLHSKGKYRLIIETFDNYQTILIETLSGLKYYGYLESIKNKSELKKLMKQLGINE